MLLFATSEPDVATAAMSEMTSIAQASGCRTVSAAAERESLRPFALVRSLLERIGFEEPLLSSEAAEVRRVDIFDGGRLLYSTSKTPVRVPPGLAAAVRDAPEEFPVVRSDADRALAAVRIGTCWAAAEFAGAPDPLQLVALRELANEAGTAAASGGRASFPTRVASMARSLAITASDAGRASPGPGRRFDLVAAKIAAVATRGPVMVHVDRFHEADFPSTRLLLHLAQQDSRLAFMIAGSVDPDSIPAGSPLGSVVLLLSDSPHLSVIGELGDPVVLRVPSAAKRGRRVSAVGIEAMSASAAESESIGEWSWAAYLRTALSALSPSSSSERRGSLLQAAVDFVRAGEPARALDSLESSRATGGPESRELASEAAVVEVEARSLLRDAVSTIEAARRAKARQLSSDEKVRVSAAETNALLDLNRLPEARGTLASVAASAAKVAPASSVPLLQARARFESMSGQAARARRTLEEAAETASGSGDSGLQGQVASNLGIVLFASGDAAGALEMHRRAERALWEAGDLTRLAYVLNNAGFALLHTGRAGSELVHFRRALAISALQGDRSSRAFILLGVAGSLISLGRFSEAETRVNEAGRLADAIGSEEIVEQCDVVRGDLRLAQGRPTEALELYRKVLRAKAMSEAWHFAGAGAAFALLGSGDASAAVREANRMLRAGADEMPPFASVSLRLTLAEAGLRSRDLRLAAAALKDAKLSPAAAWRQPTARAGRLEAELLAAEGKDPAAERAALAALKSAREMCLWEEARRCEELAARIRGGRERSEPARLTARR